MIVDTTYVSHMDRPTFFANLKELTHTKLKAKEADAVQRFAEQYFSVHPISELAGRQWSDLFGNIYAWWNYAQFYDYKKPKIRVHNPDLEEDGWLCGHTVVMALMRDMPFLVDSLRMEINQRNIAIHAISSSVMAVVRDDKGKIIEVGPQGSKLKTGKNRRLGQEALMYFEINLHTSEQEMSDLAKAIESVICEVALAVDDYQPILDKAKETIDNLNYVNTPTDVIKEDRDESQEFMRWISSGYFTCLGYSEYEFSEQKGMRVLKERVDKRLGLFKCEENKKKILAVDDFNEGMTRHHLSTQIIAFSKSGVRARVHRPSYSDYIVVKRYDKKGQVWADPDLDQAAEQMRRVVENPDKATLLGTRARADIQRMYSSEVIADKIITRLEMILSSMPVG